MVHILDEEEFITVRTSRNQYKITPEEKAILAGKKIGVIGLSVGQAVSVTLAMERICTELRLADFDLLELTNLNRIRTGVHNLGLPKVYSVAREISEIDPFIKVICFPEGITEANMHDFFTKDGKLDLLVEESDGFDIKILCRHKARELRIPVIMEGSDRCLVDVERFDLEPGRDILHGLVNHLDVSRLKQLKTNEEKIPYMLDVLGLDTASTRLKASMMEIEQTITTWPQLASAVTMGGGITADVCRRILLGTYTDSGRYHVDIEELIGNKRHPLPVTEQGGHALPDSLEKLANYASKRSSSSVLLDEQTVRDLVTAGCKAPSGGNSQPWRWIYRNKTLFLFNGFQGNSNFLGYNNYANYVALGAAARNVILRAAETGLTAKPSLFPDPENKDLVVQFEFIRAEPVSSDLSRAINKRLTNRMLGQREQIGKEILGQLKSLAESNAENVKLRFFEDSSTLDKIADLLGDLETIRLLEETGHRDFVAEIRWTEDENQSTRDGIDLRTLDLTNSERVGLEVARDAKVIDMLRNWKGGGAFKKLTRKSIDSAGAVGVLSMKGRSAENYLKGGMILQDVWLKANALGVSFQPMAASVFLFARLLDGKGQGLSDEAIKKLTKLRPVFENTLNIDPDWSEIFIFRLAKNAEPEVKSLRKRLEELFCYY
jgi:tRNA A37 threonylcarbamoyladenosine dehydratase/nitroreductase